MNTPADEGQKPSPHVEHYVIQVKGRLAAHWSDWFDGMQVSELPSGETIISGPIEDQAALHGLLNKIRDLNLSLVSVNAIQAKDYETK